MMAPLVLSGDTTLLPGHGRISPLLPLVRTCTTVLVSQMNTPAMSLPLAGQSICGYYVEEELLETAKSDANGTQAG